MKNIPCILCGKNKADTVKRLRDMHMYIDRSTFTLVRCRQCGLMYLNPQPTIEELARYYPPHYSAYCNEVSVFGQNYFYNVLRHIKRFFTSHRSIKVFTKLHNDNSSKTVLDFGCGNGTYLLGLRHNHPSWKLYGSDIQINETVKNALEKNTIVTIIGPTHLPWKQLPTKSFDRITLFQVLEHVNNPREVLENLRPLLKKDGELHIEVPNIATLKFKIFGRYFSNLDAPRHLYHFSPNTLQRLCEQCGFRITKLEVSGTTKSTVRSLYNLFHIHNRQLDPLLYSLVDILTKYIGKNRLNTEALEVRCVPAK